MISLRALIAVLKIYHPQLVVSLRQYLDSDKAQTIVLALEMNIDSLPIDERHGRQIAENFGLNTIDVLGIFIQALPLQGLMDGGFLNLGALPQAVLFWPFQGNRSILVRRTKCD